MTYKGNRTMQITQAELDALPEYRGEQGPVGAQFRGIGGDCALMVVRIIQETPIDYPRPQFLRIEILPEPTPVVQLESFSTPGTFYHVNPATGACDCPGFTYHGHCKHIRLLKVTQIPKPYVGDPFAGF